MAERHPGSVTDNVKVLAELLKTHLQAGQLLVGVATLAGVVATLGVTLVATALNYLRFEHDRQAWAHPDAPAAVAEQEPKEEEDNTEPRRDTGGDDDEREVVTPSHTRRRRQTTGGSSVAPEPGPQAPAPTPSPPRYDARAAERF